MVVFEFDLQYTKPADIDITLCKSSRLNDNVTNILKSGTQIKFGTIFTDHMLKIHYDKHAGGWQKPYITPMEHLHLHPAAKVLHYATEVLKIYKYTIYFLYIPDVCIELVAKLMISDIKVTLMCHENWRYHKLPYFGQNENSHEIRSFLDTLKIIIVYSFKKLI